jgi:hypothetical protein
MKHDGSLFVTWLSSVSRREAQVSEEIDSVWLYLTRPNSHEVAVASWLLNTPEAPPAPGQEPYRSRSAPPPAPAEYLLPGAAVPVPDASRWSAMWSADGEAVGILLDGEPIGLVRSDSRRGHARLMRGGGGSASWALPWDEAVFSSLASGGS